MQKGEKTENSLFAFFLSPRVPRFVFCRACRGLFLTITYKGFLSRQSRPQFWRKWKLFSSRAAEAALAAHGVGKVVRHLKLRFEKRYYYELCYALGSFYRRGRIGMIMQSDHYLSPVI